MRTLLENCPYYDCRLVNYDNKLFIRLATEGINDDDVDDDDDDTKTIRCDRLRYDKRN